MNKVPVTLATLLIIATTVVTMRLTFDVTVKSLGKSKTQAKCTHVSRRQT